MKKLLSVVSVFALAAIAAGTLTGAHNADQLRDAGATHVVGSPAEFADLVLQFNNIERP